MIKCIKFKGGLGNQMFQYAFYLCLKKKNPFSLWLFDTRDSRTCHNGFELDKIFNNNTTIYIKLFNALCFRIPAIFRYFKTKKQKDSLRFDSDYLAHNYKPTIYDGFWQTEKYFANCEETVRQHFVFREDLLSKKTIDCAQVIKQTNSISIHIRRGDYLQEPFRLVCNDTFYKNAIKLVETKVTNPTYFIFSDDIEYAKTHLPLSNCTYIDWNISDNSWQDMYLMSLCNHNIIANSSFSWWGAWLNNNKSKIIVAPKVWFPNEYNNDVVPETWIRI